MTKTNKCNYQGIGSVIKSMRKIKDYSVKEVAEMMNTAPSYITDVEANRKQPSMKTVEKFANIFGVRPSTLLRFSEDGLEHNYNNQKMLYIILKWLEEKATADVQGEQ